MKKWIVLVLFMACMMPVAVPQVLAAEEAPKGIVEGGNKLCPVSGDKVSGSDFVIYKGVRYGLCCPACKGPFLKDSAKYIAQMVKQEGAPLPMATVTPVISDSKAMEKKMEQSGL